MQVQLCHKQKSSTIVRLSAQKLNNITMHLLFTCTTHIFVFGCLLARLNIQKHNLLENLNNHNNGNFCEFLSCTAPIFGNWHSVHKSTTGIIYGWSWTVHIFVLAHKRKQEIHNAQHSITIHELNFHVEGFNSNKPNRPRTKWSRF